MRTLSRTIMHSQRTKSALTATFYLTVSVKRVTDGNTAID